MDLKKLEEKYAVPSKELVEDVKQIEGDIMLLGIAGKMGVSMGKLLVDALKLAGKDNKVYGVSRFSDPKAKSQVEESGIIAIACDMLNDEQLFNLPDVANVIYLAGHKFGTVGNEDFTWAMNTYLPGRVSEKFKNAKIVAFSSGNILPFVKLNEGGVDEDARHRVGEAQRAAAVEADPADQQQRGADHGQDRVVSGDDLCAITLTATQEDGADQACDARVDVNDGAAREVQHARRTEETAAPDPVADRRIDQQRP